MADEGQTDAGIEIKRAGEFTGIVQGNDIGRNRAFDIKLCESLA